MADRGSYAKSTAIKRRVLDAALEIIAAEGYRATSLGQIADRVGMSKAGVLHHFGSRENLLAEVLQRRDDIDLENADATLHDDLERLFAIVDHNSDVPGLVALYVAYTADAVAQAPGSTARRFVEHRYRRVVDVLATAITHRPEWPGDSAAATAAARLLVAAADGLQTQWLLDGDLRMGAHLRHLWESLVAEQRSAEGQHSATLSSET